MKRKDVLGFEVFVEGEKVGVVRELMLYKNDFKIDFVMIFGGSIGESYIIPFNYIKKVDDKLLVEDKNDLMDVEALVFYNEVKRSEAIFCDKDVLDEKENIIGKVNDYDFDDETGYLNNISYKDGYGIEKTINFEEIIDNAKDYIVINYEDSDSDKSSRNKDDAGVNAVGISVDYTEVINKALENFIADINAKKDKLVKSLDNLEIDFKTFCDELMKDVETKKENISNEIENDTDEYIEEITQLCKDKKKEIGNLEVNKNIVFAEDVKSNVEDIKKGFKTSKEKPPKEKSSREQSKKEKSKKEKFQKEDFLIENTFKDDLLKEDNSFESDKALEIKDDGTKPKEEDSSSIKGNLDANREKLFELQRKRMDILKKL